MATGFSTEKIRQYIEETETYYPELLNVLKGIPRYSSAAWFLSYQIGTLLETAKKLLKKDESAYCDRHGIKYKTYSHIN